MISIVFPLGEEYFDDLPAENRIRILELVGIDLKDAFAEEQPSISYDAFAHPHYIAQTRYDHMYHNGNYEGP